MLQSFKDAVSQNKLNAQECLENTIVIHIPETLAVYYPLYSDKCLLKFIRQIYGYKLNQNKTDKGMVNKGNHVQE
jgi:hypothetical protein